MALEQNKINKQQNQNEKDNNSIENQEEYVEIKIDKFKVFKQNLSDAIARLFPKDINRTRMGVPPGLHFTELMGHKPHTLDNGGNI